MTTIIIEMDTDIDQDDAIAAIKKITSNRNLINKCDDGIGRR